MKLFQNALLWTSLLGLTMGNASLLLASVHGAPISLSSTSGAAVGADDTGDVHYDAWIYPDAPNVTQALQNVGYIHGLRAEFLHINDDGSLEKINQDADHPYGYSAEFAQTLREHAKRRYITISGTMDGTSIAMQDPQTIDTIAEFAHDIGFGVELDWEGYGQWSPEYYQQYKSFITKLHDRLHDVGHTLIVDGPPIPDENAQNWYQWKYQEIAPLVDGVTMMVYDNQYDNGVGTPIAPQDWAKECMQWLKDKAGDKGIVGLAAYGYKGNRDTGQITVGPSSFIARQAGDLPRERNAAGEITADNGSTFYDFADSQTVQARVKLAKEMGMDRVSVWSLGDNPWL